MPRVFAAAFDAGAFAAGTFASGAGAGADAFALGAFAGALGDRASLGFIAETEKQVESHLRDHLGRLSAEDLRSRAILERMTHDEVEHGAKAVSLGGKALPFPITWAMRATSKRPSLACVIAFLPAYAATNRVRRRDATMVESADAPASVARQSRYA